MKERKEGKNATKVATGVGKKGGESSHSLIRKGPQCTDYRAGKECVLIS